MQVLHGLADAARMLGGISVWTLRKHISQGKVRVTRLGRRVFLASEEVERIRREGLPSLATGRKEKPTPEKAQIRSEEEQESCLKN